MVNALGRLPDDLLPKLRASAETDAVELAVEIFVSDNMNMPISTKAVGTFYGSVNDESCSYHLRPNAFMCFDFSKRRGALWIRNCSAAN